MGARQTRLLGNAKVVTMTIKVQLSYKQLRGLILLLLTLVLA